MWTGYLDFYIRVLEGDHWVWLAQHNEHRIVLSRIFFWMDLHWFGGVSYFLIIVNYFLLFLVAMTFFAYLCNNECKPKNSFLSFLLLSFFFTAAFSWVQQENLVWGFQSQFILAQLIPLVAFYFLQYSTITKHTDQLHFSLACLFGILAVGTMANGILALPIMIILALFLRLSNVKITILVMLSALSCTFYFFNYTSPPNHTSVLPMLLENPLGLIKYTLLYVGGPFYFLTGKLSTLLAYFFGTLLVSGAIIALFRLLNGSTRTIPVKLALLAYILYVGGTAFITAGGRLEFGLEQALSSRYQTPALMAWIALIIIYSTDIEKFTNKYKKIAPMIFSVILFGFIPSQIVALNDNSHRLHLQQLGAVALAMGVNDNESISTLIWSKELGMTLTEKAVHYRLGIFGGPGFQFIADNAANLEAYQTKEIPKSCLNDKVVDEIIDDSNYTKVSWTVSCDFDFPSYNIVAIFSGSENIQSPSGFGMLAHNRGYDYRLFAYIHKNMTTERLLVVTQ